MARNPRENVPPELKYKPRDRHARYIPKTARINAPMRSAIRERFGRYGMTTGPGVVAKTGYRFGPSGRMSLEVIAADYVCLYDTLDISQFWLFGQLDDWGSGEDHQTARTIPSGRRKTVLRHLDRMVAVMVAADPEFAVWSVVRPTRPYHRNPNRGGD